MVGKTISHYEILEKLGEGGMGVVYKAHDNELDRIVALKFLPHYLTSDATEKERFYHEARAASALNHPNITTIYEIKEFEHQLYLAMEFVEGKTLKKLVEQEPPSVKKVLDIAIQACEGLAAAHEKGIVHRDIKSDNIMLTTKSQVKIMDFGLAKVKGATKLTKAGSTLGTAAYMSPEQAQGEEVDHRSDIFSFGVVLYELLTTKLPFREEHQAALMYSLINEDPQPMARFNDAVSPELERIVLKALSKDRDERYQHIDDMLADVRKERKTLEYAKAGYVRSTVAMPAVEPVKAKKSYKGYLITGAAVVLLVIGVLIFNPFNVQISTQQTSAAPGKLSLAVMYFQNISDPEDKQHTGLLLSDLLITALSQTKGLEVVSRERLFDIQKEIQADAKVITPETATKIAQRAGVSTMLLGSILEMQPELALTVRLVDVKSGNIIHSERVTGFTPNRIFSLADTLALLVRNDLHVGVSSPAETKSVMEVTTKSPEAYRSYIEGVQLNDKFFEHEASAAFRKAIELDSNFALAYLGLAMLNVSNISNAEQQSLIQKAWQLRANVNELERLNIEASHAAMVERDIPKSIQIRESIVQKYPHELDNYLVVGMQYSLLGNFDKGIAAFNEGIAVDSSAKNIWNVLAYGYLSIGRKQEAVAAIDHYLQLAPAEPNPYDSKGDIYFGFGDIDSAKYWWSKALSFRSDFTSSVKLGFLSLGQQNFAEAQKYFSQYVAGLSKPEDKEVRSKEVLANTAAYQGRVKESLKYLEELISYCRERHLNDNLVECYELEAMSYYELGNYTGMIDAVQRRISEVNDRDLTPLQDRDLLAFSYLAAGRKNDARSLIGELKRGWPHEIRMETARLDYLDALDSFESGNFEDALGKFRLAFQGWPQQHAPQYFYALSLLKAGHTDDAIHELKRHTWWMYFGDARYDLSFFPVHSSYTTIASAKAHYWLGVAYEQQGKRTEAIKEYEKFLAIWKNADFKSKELDDARSRLSRLKEQAAR